MCSTTAAARSPATAPGSRSGSGRSTPRWPRSASIHRERRSGLRLPAAEEDALSFFVREPWPSAATGTELSEGLLGAGAALEVQCEMNAGGVVFGDGIEADHLTLDWGQRVEVRVADSKLQLAR